MKNSYWPTTKFPPGVLPYTTTMVPCMEQLFTVSMQQLACKLHGRHPVKQFAFLSTTCPVCAMLTYLLEEYELALEIISQWILASADRVKLLQSPCCVNTDNAVTGLSSVDKNYHEKMLLGWEGSINLLPELTFCEKAVSVPNCGFCCNLITI